MKSKAQVFLIVGLGLIGGSLAAAIRKRFPKARVLAASRNPESIRFAKKKKWIHDGFFRLDQALFDADFIFVCTPVDTIPELLSKIDRWAKPKTIVTDAGSTKSEIVRSADRRRFKNIRFIGSHPLAGSHLTGVRHAKANLFERAFVFVTPTQKSNPSAVQAISKFWKQLRMNVRILSPETHDALVCEISHLPHAIASVLMNTVSQNAGRYAASGFLDTTRIAEGDPKLWEPIFLTNRKNLISSLSRFQLKLLKLQNALKKNSHGEVHRILGEASRKRVGLKRAVPTHLTVAS